MKAAEVPTGSTAPHIVELAPSAFTEAWSTRPRATVRAGLRRLSADECLLAHTEAAEKADAFHPGLDHSDQVWLTSYDILRLHIVLGFALVEPTDVTAAWMAGRFTGDLVEMSGEKAVSSVFTDAGLSRLYDEFEVLTVLDSPTQPPIDEEELATMVTAIAAGEFFATINPGQGPDEEATKRIGIVDGQIRTLLGYVYRLHRDGYAPARG